MNRPSGFTLLEVIVALALMGSVLAGSLLAFSKHRKQLSMAQKRIEATMIADRLLQELAVQQGGVPINQRGPVIGKDDWYWQTTPAGTTSLATAEMRLVRFQILEVGLQPTQLVSVEFVLPAALQQ